TESTAGCEPPSCSTAFHCAYRAGGTLNSPPLVKSTCFHGLQLRSGLSTFPLRASSSTLPFPRKSARPHREKIFASNTSLSYDPSFSAPAPTTNTFPRLLVTA